MPKSQEVSLTASNVLAFFERRRAELGSVDALADEVGIGRNTMTDFLLGNREPNARTAPKLREYAARHWVDIQAGTSEKHERLELRGRAIEVQALLAYAQERLRLLTDAPYATDGPENAVNLSAPVAPRRSARG